MENSNSGHVCHSPQHSYSPVYVTIPEPRTLAIDVLSQYWQGRSMYMFPPFPLLNKVIQKLGFTQEGKVILKAPWWPSQPWFLHLSVCGPLLHHSGTYCHNRGMSRMASRTICMHGGSLAALPSNRIYKKRSLDSQQLLEDPQQTECMTTHGFASLTGPQDNELIHFVPQLLK